jgi:hypothetical protein
VKTNLYFVPGRGGILGKKGVFQHPARLSNPTNNVTKAISHAT